LAAVIGIDSYPTKLHPCDFAMKPETQRRLVPIMESAIIAVVRPVFLEGMEQHPPKGAIAMIAATTSWAIYGAAKEWVRTPNRSPSHEIVDTVVKLIAPILSAMQASAMQGGTVA
jgi:hypothetical protein